MPDADVCALASSSDANNPPCVRERVSFNGIKRGSRAGVTGAAASSERAGKWPMACRRCGGKSRRGLTGDISDGAQTWRSSHTTRWPRLCQLAP